MDQPATTPSPTTAAACVINCAVYRDGVREDIPLDRISDVLARDDGSFVDIVFWQTHEAALAASGKMMEEMAQSEAMTMIDPMGLEMSHGTIRLSVD